MIYYILWTNCILMRTNPKVGVVNNDPLKRYKILKIKFIITICNYFQFN